MSAIKSTQLDIIARPLNVRWSYFKTDISGTSSHILSYVFRYTTATSSLSAATVVKTVQEVYANNADVLVARAGLLEGFLFGDNGL